MRVDAWVWKGVVERLDEWRSLVSRIDDANATGDYDEESQLIREQQQIADETMLFLNEEIGDDDSPVT